TGLERSRAAAQRGQAAHRIDSVRGRLALRHRIAVAPLPGPQRLDRDRRRARERADRQHPAGGPLVLQTSAGGFTRTRLGHGTYHLGPTARTNKTCAVEISWFEFSHGDSSLRGEAHKISAVWSKMFTSLILNPPPGVCRTSTLRST